MRITIRMCRYAYVCMYVYVYCMCIWLCVFMCMSDINMNNHVFYLIDVL